MAEKKIIVVFGATGAQGGGMARAILADPSSEFKVRAVTRDVNSDKAKELAKLGAEVVAADLDDPASVNNALKGAYGAFCITFFWNHLSPEKETAQAKTMADAAKANNLKHVIWSTLEDTRKWVPLSDNRMPTLHGHYKVPHFDAKGEADPYFAQIGVPTTCLLTSFYWENFIFFGSGPQKDQNGNLALTFPMDDKKLPSIAVDDIGKCAYTIFKRGNEFIGKTVGIAGGHITGAQFATAFTKALGREVKYNNVDPDVYRSFGFPAADDVGNMFQFKRDFEDYYCGARSLEFTRTLNPSLQSFESWLAAHKDLIPLG